jgi:signal transduction histidine kinase
MGTPQVTQLRVALQHLSVCRDIDTLFTTLLSEARRLLGGKVGLAWLMSDADQWHLQQTIGVTVEIPSRLQRLMLPPGGERAVVRRLRYLGYRSILLGSLHRRGRPVGLVALCSRRRRRFRRMDTERLRLLNHHAEVIMESPGFRATAGRPEIEMPVDEGSDPAERAEILHLLSPLISRITHDLNNVLTVIGGHIELSLHQPQNQSTLQHLGASLRGVHQAGDVIRDLHDLLSMQRGGEHGLFDLNQVVHDCVQLARSSWFMERIPQRSPIHLVIDLHPVPPLTGSAPDLKVTLLILLRHLMNVMRPGRTLTLRTWTDRENGRQEVFLELADEPGGVHIGEREGGLEPASISEQSPRIEPVPRLVEAIVRRLGGRIVVPHASDARMTLIFTLAIPRTSSPT